MILKTLKYFFLVGIFIESNVAKKSIKIANTLGVIGNEGFHLGKRINQYFIFNFMDRKRW